MELKELLEHFNNGDTLGEDFEVIELMRYYSRQAQKITMQINTQYHEPEELASLFSELIGKPVGSDEKNHKSTYVTLTSLAEARKLAQDTVAEAVAALAIFGPEADFLRDLVNYLVDRNK